MKESWHVYAYHITKKRSPNRLSLGFLEVEHVCDPSADGSLQKTLANRDSWRPRVFDDNNLIGSHDLALSEPIHKGNFWIDVR